jgi:hypothetical protein
MNLPSDTNPSHLKRVCVNVYCLVGNSTLDLQICIINLHNCKMREPLKSTSWEIVGGKQVCSISSQQCSGSVKFLIRIRIRGFVPLDYGSGSYSGSCYFLQWLSRCQRKYAFFLSFFLITSFGSSTSIFKDKKL